MMEPPMPVPLFPRGSCQHLDGSSLTSAKPKRDSQWSLSDSMQ